MTGLRITGLLTAARRLRTLLRVRAVAIARLRCQDKPFSRLQGFAGKPIDEFPPCRFYRMAAADRGDAFEAFRAWLRECLLDLGGWKVPKSEGGWRGGPLCQIVVELHRERGIELVDFEQADAALVDEAVGRRARHYLGVLDSIRRTGYVRSTYPPIYCRSKGSLYVIHSGHHRVAALRALGREEAFTEIMEGQT